MSPEQQAINPTAATDPVIQARYVASYVHRRAYKDEIQRPPAVPAVKDAIDLHCHAHEGQQDALAVAKHASANGMGGILYKTVIGRRRPAEVVRNIAHDLEDWCNEVQVEPIKTWAGWNIGIDLGKLATAEEALAQIQDGVKCIWMPNNTHANSFMLTPNRAMLDRAGVSEAPLPWEKAREFGGNYLMDEHGHLLQQVKDIFQVIADKDVAVSFGHATHPEIYEMAEQVQKLGIKKAFADHPFSPFVALSVEQMKQLAAAGIYMNFTYDELSPLLGLNPATMAAAIKEVGPEHCTLSSDCGEPLFPNSVEGMRQIKAYMRAFGLDEEEAFQVSAANPARVIGLA